jgi:hypothetical protein
MSASIGKGFSNFFPLFKEVSEAIPPKGKGVTPRIFLGDKGP